jgi:hypothetical protein
MISPLQLLLLWCLEKRLFTADRKLYVFHSATKAQHTGYRDAEWTIHRSHSSSGRWWEFGQLVTFDSGHIKMCNRQWKVKKIEEYYTFALSDVRFLCELEWLLYFFLPASNDGQTFYFFSGSPRTIHSRFVGYIISWRMYTYIYRYFTASYRLKLV